MADYERTILEIVRSLPPDRAKQLIDFARFLEAQNSSDQLYLDKLTEGVKAENAPWDALLESDKGQMLLEKLAEEALAEHRAGRTTPIR
jgi:hypothetical protein